MEYTNKLQEWQEKYQRAVNEFEDVRVQMLKNQRQYDGTLQPDKGKETECIYNFTRELIESEVDANIPAPKVEPVIKNDRNLKLAKVIEAMLNNEMKRINMDPINDVDERNTKIMGGDTLLIEWNNAISTHDTVGDIDLRLVEPTRFTPQEGVYDIKKMDYFFLDFEDTKSNIMKKYGVDVSEEGVDPDRATDEDAPDTVTHVWAFYKNEKQNLGIFCWVGDTVVIDDDNYQARAKEVCRNCGKARAEGETVCTCGSSDWEMRHLDYEELDEDVIRDDGSIIPAMSYAKDEYGNYLYQDVPVQATQMDPVTGEMKDVYERTFDSMGMVIGEQPVMTTEQRAYQIPTRIPYYVPKTWPVCLRRNVSVSESLFGDSDAEMIFPQQDKANKIATLLISKTMHNGQVLTKLKQTDFKFSNGFQVLETNSMDEIGAIKSLDLRFDVNSDINMINQLYYWAKSLLGINDSSQGKADTTAKSGRAKEAQIQRAQARQSSKMIMKNAFYQDVYRAIMEYALAYMDEPRSYGYIGDDGEDEDLTFNRYDFLEQDQYGNWFYNDQFIITIDSSGNIADNRESVLELMANDFQAGLYGDPSDAETLLAFWKDRDSLNYPNAKRMVARWQKKVETQKQMQAMQAQLAQIKMQTASQQPGAEGGNANAMPGM